MIFHFHFHFSNISNNFAAFFCQCNFLLKKMFIAFFLINVNIVFITISAFAILVSMLLIVLVFINILIYF